MILSATSCGICVYRRSISIVTSKLELLSNCKSSKELSTVVLPRICKGLSLTNGLRKKSTYCARGFKMELQPDTIGRSSGFARFLWILGSMYIAVVKSDLLRNACSWSLRKPCSRL